MEKGQALVTVVGMKEEQCKSHVNLHVSAGGLGREVEREE